MDANQFDNLVRRLDRGEIGRRQFVIRLLALGLGVGGATRLAQAQDAEPTATPGSLQASAGSGQSGQQFPCPPGPTGPFDWICGTGPFNPWYPIIAPPDMTASTGIRWYGFQGLEDGGLRAAAFDRANQEISHYEARAAGGVLRWSIDGAGATVGGYLEFPKMDGSLIEIAGEINGFPFRSRIGPNGVPEPSPDNSIALSASQQLLFAQWQPAVERLDSLLELALTTDRDPLAGSDLGCFMAGYIFVVTVPFCFNPYGCLPAGGALGYMSSECTSEW